MGITPNHIALHQKDLPPQLQAMSFSKLSQMVDPSQDHQPFHPSKQTIHALSPLAFLLAKQAQ
jgi:hypothetical protein